MKAFKLFGGLFVLILAIIIGVVIYVMTNLNQIVKKTVETVGPTVTETSVALRDVDIEPLKGRGELNHFVIGNPEGFDSEYLLKWESIGLEIDPASVSSDVIVIKNFSIKGINIIAEQKGYTTNLQKLMETLEKGSSSSNQASSGDTGGQTDVRLALEHLDFADNSLQFVTEKYGSYTLDIPDFDLSNIGDKNVGLTPEEMGQAILKPLVAKAKRAVEKRIKEIGKEELKAKLDEKKEELEAKVDEKKDELKEKLKEETSEISDQISDEDKEKLKEKLKEKEDKLKKLFK